MTSQSNIGVAFYYFFIYLFFLLAFYLLKCFVFLSLAIFKQNVRKILSDALLAPLETHSENLRAQNLRIKVIMALLTQN